MDEYFVNNQLPAIDQTTIECDMRTFVRWLNQMADNVNYLMRLYPDLRDRVESNTQRIECLEARMDAIEERVDKLEACCEEVRQWIAAFNLDAINNAINMLYDRLQWFYDHLPTVYGNIPNDWKFAMGNINVMSANNGTPSISGPGLFTSMQIENNDLYFN